MASNIGNQTVTLLYHTRADSGAVNRRHTGIRQTGIYSGGYLTVVDSSNARLSVLDCEVSDGTYQVKISTGTTVTVAVAQATPYIVLRWVYIGSETNDYMSIIAVASPSVNDLVVALCTFTGGGNLQGFDYSERSTPNTMDLFLKVEPTATTELRVRVRAGRIQNGKETIQIPDQKTSLFTPPTSNSKVYLVYVDKGTGVVAIDSSGVAAVSPVPPNYAGKHVIAEVTLAAGATNIVAANIIDMRDFANVTSPVDNSTIEVTALGRLAVKAGVIGQSTVKAENSQLEAPLTMSIIPDMTINMTTTGGNVALDFTTCISPRADQTVTCQIWVDGAGVITNKVRVNAGLAVNNYIPLNMVWLVYSLAAGPHTFSIHWVGTYEYSSPQYMNYPSVQTNRVFRVIELPHLV